jgi:hypothetical protein
MYRGLRLMTPLVRSALALGLPGLDGVVELTVPGRRTGHPRTTPITILRVEDRWYVGHPNGECGWTRNAAAVGEIRIDPPGARGDRFRVVRLAPGDERDAVIRSTWTQQPFPGRLVYRAARRHVAAVGVYHRLEPIPDPPATPGNAAPLGSPEPPAPPAPPEGAR